MKKILLLICVISSFFACSKDEDSKYQIVYVNVYYQGDLATPSVVRLYDYKEAIKCNFDYETMCEYGDKSVLLDNSGNEIIPKYTSVGSVNNFEEVENGKYILIAMHKPNGYSFPMFYFYGYKEIIVDGSSTNIHKINFTNDDRGKFKKIE